MDCNREEALRAKQLAEKKMESKDFSAALKIAAKAQQLYPELENVSQMILVCEVHCSAEKKIYGNEKDWYGILKIEPSADDLSIKKQYRKLALVLHPDKNKFSGSSDAFKLIGEAQRVLLDREKRMIHDSKRRAFGNPFPRPPSRQAHHPWNQTSFTQAHSVNPHFPGGRSGNFTFTQQRAQTGVSGNRQTFWTVCPYCSVRYQFYRDDVLNKAIHCQSCKKSFSAFELNIQGGAATVPPGTTTQSRHVPVFPQQNTSPPFRAAEGQNRNFTTNPLFGNSFRAKEQGNASRKRKKKVQESSESSDSESSSESEEEEAEEGSDGSEDENVKPKNKDKPPANSDFQHFGEPPRRSSRPKRNVSYKENVNDNDDDAIPSNKAKKRDSSSLPTKPEVEDTFWKAEITKMDTKDHKIEPDPDPNSDNKPLEPEEETEPEVYHCPDPEFSDFDKERKEGRFRAGQIWAVYDTEDAMPRFYAFIKKLVSLSPVFKLQIAWLEFVPQNDQETKWVEEELPVSCGKFTRRKTADYAEDLPMFSHLVSFESPKTMFNIFPRTGETWAVFKNWSENNPSSSVQDDGTRKYEYDFVEILSDFDDENGVRVLYLEKLKGFVCLFGRKEAAGEAVIPASEKLRFSHMVPSCRMTGEEREGVKKGSYELDPAALPSSTFEKVSL